MKKIILSALLISSITFGADAVTYAYDVASNYTGTYALSSPASFASKKFYVNAGHGGFDSNDRPTAMPLLGSEYFYESEGNLDRAKHLQKFFTSNNGQVQMSRTTNTSSDDLGLTTIATLSNSYGGYFMSLHSNGANASANYVVAFYRGPTTGASTNVISPSKAMSQAVADWHDVGKLTNVTYSTPRGLSDYAFNGWNYGVLRTNNRPGYLVETWFHDYRPESLRMKASVYNKFLAWQIARAVMVSPGGCTGSLPACIIGDIRDESASCGYTNYTTRGRDAYLAVNGAKVSLINSSGATVATHTTDSKGNGVYGFFVPAGTYTIKVQKDGYVDQSATVTVTANNITKQNFSIVKGVNAGISVATGAVSCGEITKGETVTKTVAVTGTSLSSNITVTNSNTTHFSVTPTSFDTSGGTLTIKYTPTVAGNHSTTITLASGSYTAKITVTGSAKNPPLEFTEVWNYSENSGKKASWMSDFANYRNMAFGDGKLYIVDYKNAVIKVVKAQTGDHIKDLDMTNVSGGALAICDVAFSEGKIIATNIALSSNDTMKTLKVYIWDNDDATPRVLLETTDLGGMTRIGDCVDIKGNLTSGKLVYLAQQTRDYTASDGSTANGNCNSLVTYALTNGVASTTPVVADLDAFILGTSPRAVPDGDNFWVMGLNYFPSQINDNGELLNSISSSVFNVASAGHGAGNDISRFTFNGTEYAFATDYASVDINSDGTCSSDEIKNQNLKNGCAVLIEGSNGWNAENLAGSGRYPVAGMGSTKNANASSSICTAVNGSDGVEMWVLINYQGIAYYKHGTAPTYTYEKVPEITAPAEYTISTIEGMTETGTIAVTAELLTSDITLSISGSSAFSIDKTSLGTSGGTITVTFKPTVAGSHTATITLSSAGATTKTITLKGTAEAAIAQGLTKVWQNTSSVPGTATGGDVRFAAVSNGKLIANDKANQKIIEITSTGYSDFYDPSAAITANYSQTLGTAIACDDAGNILVNSGFSTAKSGSNFTLISADLKSTYKIDLSTISGYTAIRCDQLGRIRGNMLSSEGAYAFFAPSSSTAGTTTLIVKIVNGTIDTDYTQISNPMGISVTDGVAQPALATVAEINALMDENGDISNSFYLRYRGVPGSVFAWNSDNSAMEKAWSFTESTSGYKTANASVNGFDWFKLYDKSYFIMPLTTDGTSATRGSVFGIFDEAGKCVAEWSEGEKTGLGAAVGSFIAVPNNNYSVFIYHFVPGTVAEKFTFAVEPQSTGVEEIESSVIEENIDTPVEYYNLQGVKVNADNLNKGIYIKVQGKKVSKIYVR